MNNSYDSNDLDVAIIGMSGRFPEARNIQELWQNLVKGKDSITRGEITPHKNFINAYGKLENVEYFDADFFGFNKREAEMSDPQQRILLEGTYEALESAGYCCDDYSGKIGLFCGCDEHLYVWNYLFNKKGNLYANYTAAKIYMDGTFSNEIAYKLNLKGPSILAKYACATSLATVHLAYQSLLNYECDIAVAGGVSVEPEQEGYFMFDGAVSSDGYTKSFDASANGFVPGSAMGLVVLKRLEEAIEDHDNIYAVIKGSALNNDGNRKIGFSAPSVQGQQEAIRDAIMLANIEPSDVGYIETHGTATVLGDAVEIRALKNIFSKNAPDKKVYIGSIKPNIGHTNVAAGIAGLIKAVLILKNKIIPPTLYYKNPNDELLEEDCPLLVNDELRQWGSSKSRIAGVSSFGMGGANVHVIVEEYEDKKEKEESDDYELVILNGRTINSLKSNAEKLSEYLKNNEANMRDIAFTLQNGRKSMEYRFYAVCKDKQELISCLDNIKDSQIKKNEEKLKKEIVFMFSGSGSQGFSIGKECYVNNRAFKEEIDKCFDIAEKILRKDLTQLFLNYDAQEDIISKNPIDGMILTFSVGYAIAKMWMSLGIKPDVIVGHSLGEYIGACISGILSLKDAIYVIVKRSELFNKLTEGAMISVAAGEEEILPYLAEKVNIAAINAKDRILLSGNVQDIDSFTKVLKEKNIKYAKLNVNRAGHCYLIDEILEEYKSILDKVTLNSTNIPIISTYTGEMVRKNEMSTSQYWLEQMRNSVKFYPVIKKLCEKENAVFIEIGSSRQLTSLIRKEIRNNKTLSAVASFGEARFGSSMEGFLGAVGRVWSEGKIIKWDKLYKNKPYRVDLPTYQFERKYYWKYVKGLENTNKVTVDVLENSIKEIESIEKKENKSNDYRNHTDEVVANIFKDMLGIEEIGIYDNLYDIGFDSLSSVLISSRIESELGVRITIKEIYNVTSIAEISDYILNSEAKIEKVSSDEKNSTKNLKNIDDIFKEL